MLSTALWKRVSQADTHGVTNSPLQWSVSLTPLLMARIHILAGAVKSQYLTVLPRPHVILWSSGKCPFRSPWITSFQMKSHNIFTFTSMDAVSYVKNFCAIHCPCFSSALPSLSCRSQSCRQTFTCGHIIAMAHWYPLFPLLLFLISLWLFLTSSNQQTSIFLEVSV